METPIAATPFGARPLSLSHLATGRMARARPADASAHKWHLYSWIRTARVRLGLSERALAILHALLSCYPEIVLAGPQLVVFPSNEYLAMRAHDMAAATLRRHLAVLVEAGLVLRRDSPNGKRYARKGPDGAIVVAFGFDLAPLVARAGELERLADEIKAEKRDMAMMRERISLHRRDIAKMIAAGMEHGVPVPQGRKPEGDPADWPALHAHFRGVVDRMSRCRDRAGLEAGAADLSRLAAEILNLLEIHLETTNLSASESQNERHIQNSKTEPSLVFEDREEESGKPNAALTPGPASADRPPIPTHYPLELVMEACPDLADYASTGTIGDWRALEAAAATVRPMLGISTNAFEEACAVMGRLPAAITVAAILQRGEAIQSAGGYLRALTARARARTFSLSPMLMALVRKRHRAAEAARE